MSHREYCEYREYHEYREYREHEFSSAGTIHQPDRPGRREGRRRAGARYAGWAFLWFAAWCANHPLAAQAPATGEPPPGEPPASAPSADRVEPAAGAVTEQVVVTALRYEQPLDQVPASIAVLDSAALRGAAQTLDDTLRQVPGFSLFRRASSAVAHPTTQGVSLRGIAPSGTSRTLVLVDGVPLNDAFGGWVYWSRVPQLGLDRVEIVRGGGSNVWGNSALGGVVQVLTGGDGENAFSFVVSGGERSAELAEGLFHREFGRGRVQAQGSWFSTDGYPTVRADQRGAVDIPAASEHGQGLLRGGLDFGDSAHLHLTLERFDEERANGTPYTGNDTRTDAVTLRVLVARRAAEWSGYLASEEQEFASTFSGVAANRSSETPALDQFLVDSSAQRAGLRLWRRLDGKREHRLFAGADGEQVDGTTNEDFFFAGGAFQRRRRAGGERSSYGAYAGDALAFGRFRLEAGVRYDRWELRDGEQLETNIVDGSVRLFEAFPDRSEDELSPRVGLTVELPGFGILYGSFYRSFRAPTINELYRPFRVGNDITAAFAGLLSEELLGFDLGFRLRRAGNRLDLAVFANRVEDVVANVTVGVGPGVVGPCGFVPAGGTCRQRRNLDRISVAGLETDYRRRFGERHELTVRYLRSEPEVHEASVAPELVGLRVAQVPRDQGTLRWDVRLERWSLALQLRAQGSQFDDDRNERELDGYAVGDLSAERTLGRRLVLFAGVENFWGEEVEVGRSATGLINIGAPRLVHAGLRARFGG